MADFAAQPASAPDGWIQITLLLLYDNDQVWSHWHFRRASTTLPAEAAMISDRSADEVWAQLRQTREMLMGGRGCGAGAAEVAAHTRDRVMIGGQRATQRLEITARHTGYARRDVAALTRTAQLTQGELAETVVQLARRLRPRRQHHRRALPVAGTAVGRRLRAHPILFLLGSAAMVLLIRRRQRDLRRTGPE